MTSVVEMASAFELWRGMSDGGVSRNDIEACISRVVTRYGNIKDLIVVWAIIRDIDGNCGWRDGSKWLFVELYKYKPKSSSFFNPNLFLIAMHTFFIFISALISTRIKLRSRKYIFTLVSALFFLFCFISKIFEL